MILALLLVVSVVGIGGCYVSPARGRYYGPSRVVVVHERHWR